MPKHSNSDNFIGRVREHVIKIGELSRQNSITFAVVLTQLVCVRIYSDVRWGINKDRHLRKNRTEFLDEDVRVLRTSLWSLLFDTRDARSS